jgi:hypothetical protein
VQIFTLHAWTQRLPLLRNHDVKNDVHTSAQWIRYEATTTRHYEIKHKEELQDRVEGEECSYLLHIANQFLKRSHVIYRVRVVSRDKIQNMFRNIGTIIHARQLQLIPRSRVHIRKTTKQKEGLLQQPTTRLRALQVYSSLTHYTFKFHLTLQRRSVSVLYKDSARTVL